MKEKKAKAKKAKADKAAEKAWAAGQKKADKEAAKKKKKGTEKKKAAKKGKGAKGAKKGVVAIASGGEGGTTGTDTETINPLTSIRPPTRRGDGDEDGAFSGGASSPTRGVRTARSAADFVTETRLDVLEGPPAGGTGGMGSEYSGSSYTSDEGGRV